MYSRLPSAVSSSSSSISLVKVSLMQSLNCSSRKVETTSLLSVGMSVRPSFSTQPRSMMVFMIEAYVEGRPIPRFSSSLMRPASVQREGGCVSLPSASRSISVSGSPVCSFGTSTSSPRARTSTVSHPSNMTREPVAAKSGIVSFESVMFATILVR